MSSPAETLWCEVLSLAISDALTGASSASKCRATRIHEIERNRKYLTVQNTDFDIVCSLAGVDPVATREHLISRIADAPAPEALISVKRRAQRRTTRSIARPSTMRGGGQELCAGSGDRRGDSRTRDTEYNFSG